MRGPRLLVAAAVVAVLVAAGVLIATAGSDDGGGSSPVETATKGADRGDGAVAGEARSGDDSEDRPRGDTDEPGADGPADDTGPSGEPGVPASDGDPGDEFAAQLRSIVGSSLAELAPLAQGTAAAQDPDGYADMLATGASQIDDTIDELEALDPPAGAEEGTQQLIAAYDGLGQAVAQGSKDFSTGDGKRIQKALGYLAEAAGQFRADLGTATQALSAAGFSAPSIR